MSTSAKIKASRRNGKKSRGPKSAGGKERSSRNRFLYTIDPSRFIAAGEDAAEFRELARIVLTEYQPRTEFERMLVHQLCYELWQLQRLQQDERAVLDSMYLGSALVLSVDESSAASQKASPLRQILNLQNQAAGITSGRHPSAPGKHPTQGGAEFRRVAGREHPPAERDVAPRVGVRSADVRTRSENGADRDVSPGGGGL
jgi:hypothetical protein